MSGFIGGGGVRAFVGEIRYGFWSTSPDSNNWLLLYGSIGDTGSGADVTGSKYQALYEHLWSVLADAEAPVSGGRGANGAADFAAGKTLTMPDHRGRTPIGVGTGGGLTARVLGVKLGQEGHELSVDEGPNHLHAQQGITMLNTGGAGIASSGGSGVTLGGNTGYSGSGTAHNTMQPSVVVTAIIKY